MFKAVVVIAVCLLQSPKARAARSAASPAPTGHDRSPRPARERQVAGMSTDHR